MFAVYTEVGSHPHRQLWRTLAGPPAPPAAPQLLPVSSRVRVDIAPVSLDGLWAAGPGLGAAFVEAAGWAAPRAPTQLWVSPAVSLRLFWELRGQLDSPSRGLLALWSHLLGWPREPGLPSCGCYLHVRGPSLGRGRALGRVCPSQPARRTGALGAGLAGAAGVRLSRSVLGGVGLVAETGFCGRICTTGAGRGYA